MDTPLNRSGQLEYLLITGIALALLEKQGCLDLLAALENGEVFFRNEQTCLAQTNDTADYSTWRFDWTDLYEVRSIPPVPPSPKGAELSSHIEAVFLVDPADSWTLEKFSVRCGLSAVWNWP